MRYRLLTIAVLCANACWGQSAVAPLRAQPTRLNDGRTAIDDYVQSADDTYRWELVTRRTMGDMTVYVIDLKSQTWLTAAEVDRPVWQHWLTVVQPRGATATTAMMFVDGGRNGRNPPAGPDGALLQVAQATRSVVASIGMIPNQPLTFHGDGKPRYEDDLIGYTWDQFLKTGDTRWPARLPMVKSVVRAMDTVQALFAESENDGPRIDGFVVAGGSKRGWTTWMTAAVDGRVKAIAPIVIDVLNANVSMEHHYAAYGFWAPAIGDYVEHKIVDRRFTPRYQQLLQLVDPFAYRDRLTMPKCVINATGDEFFLPDSSQFYFDRLRGEKHLCYVPNSNHSLDGTKAMETLIAFHHAIVHEIPRPEFEWTFPAPNSIRVQPKTPPERVLLWQATNPTARDFRVDTIGRAYEPVELQAQDNGDYLAAVDTPPEGWTAFFVQLEFDIDCPTPMRLTTPVRVIPETLPFADKQPPIADEDAK